MCRFPVRQAHPRAEPRTVTTVVLRVASMSPTWSIRFALMHITDTELFSRLFPLRWFLEIRKCKP
jgi:hypothetical protein